MVVFLALISEQVIFVGAYAVCPCVLCSEKMSDVRVSISTPVVVQ